MVWRWLPRASVAFVPLMTWAECSSVSELPWQEGERGTTKPRGNVVTCIVGQNSLRTRLLLSQIAQPARLAASGEDLCFAMVKPDMVEDGMEMSMVREVLRQGYRLVAIERRTMSLPETKFQQPVIMDHHFHCLSDEMRRLYSSLAEYQTMGNMVALCLARASQVPGEGMSELARLKRAVVRPRFRRKGLCQACTELVRTDRIDPRLAFHCSVRNGFHCSDSAAESQRELGLFFPAMVADMMAGSAVGDGPGSMAIIAPQRFTAYRSELSTLWESVQMPYSALANVETVVTPDDFEFLETSRPMLVCSPRSAPGYKVGFDRSWFDVLRHHNNLNVVVHCPPEMLLQLSSVAAALGAGFAVIHVSCSGEGSPEERDPRLQRLELPGPDQNQKIAGAHEVELRLNGAGEVEELRAAILEAGRGAEHKIDARVQAHQAATERHDYYKYDADFEYYNYHYDQEED